MKYGREAAEHYKNHLGTVANPEKLDMRSILFEGDTPKWWWSPFWDRIW